METVNSRCEMELTASTTGTYFPRDFMYNRCNTSILNSNSREDEVIIVHFTNETEIDFDKIFNRERQRLLQSMRKESTPIRPCRIK
ncbi:Oidioi.mRNA.OKI2018_I69.PAR.g9180.t1.cds [Oikopleura dioica]|uniref:Oidioi.mRNA.OKI2018_I69.PAR.g9180.t1.cds n=1 Tax=Oikopleura dioica TaxID=34765 RepID=A0ABN7RJD2_OIKDI|nr:Oidioi.mRNA.OKI2018_I69.PAR.g9180.t1.cds [Oikopleura dioica]